MEKETSKLSSTPQTKQKIEIINLIQLSTNVEQRCQFQFLFVIPRIDTNTNLQIFCLNKYTHIKVLIT